MRMKHKPKSLFERYSDSSDDERKKRRAGPKPRLVESSGTSSSDDDDDDYPPKKIQKILKRYVKSDKRKSSGGYKYRFRDMSEDSDQGIHSESTVRIDFHHGAQENSGRRIKKKTAIFEPTFSREPAPARYCTMYGALHNNRQGPHTIPFALMETFLGSADPDTVYNMVPKPDEFETACLQEEIHIDSEKILGEYNALYGRMGACMEEGQPDSGDSEFSYPGNMEVIGWREAAGRMLNMHPYASYHWRSRMNYHEESQHRMIGADGTERVANSELKENTKISMDTALRSLDGLDARANEYRNQEAFYDYLRSILSPMVDVWNEEKFQTYLSNFR